MIVTCEHCAARYKLDPKRITGRGVRITCPRCKNVFVVYSAQTDEVPAPDEAEPFTSASSPSTAKPASDDVKRAPSPPSSPKPAPRAAAEPDEAEATAIFKRSTMPGAASLRRATPPSTDARQVRPSVDSLDFASVGIQAWKVKVRIGLIYDFSDYKTLARYIKEGRVGDDDQISHDGETWTRIGDIDDLEEHFIQVYLDAKRAKDAAPTPDAFDDDGPTMIVGASDVAKSMPSLAKPATVIGGGDDGDIAAATAAAMAAEDVSYNSSTTGNDAAGPRFQDPFAQARNKNSGRSRRSSSKPSAASKKEEKGSRSMLFVIAAGALIGGAGVGAWYVLQNQKPTQDLEAQARQARQQEMVNERTKAAEEHMRNRVAEQLEQVMDATDATDPFIAEDPEDVRIPIGPDGKPVGQGTTNSPKVTTADDGSGTMTESVSTPADHFAAGNSAYRSGDYTNAVRGFKSAANGDPGNATYHYWLGAAYDKTGDSSGAQRHLRQAGSMGYYPAYKLLGDVMARLGDNAGAIGHYNTYLGSNPADAGAVQGQIDALTN